MVQIPVDVASAMGELRGAIDARRKATFAYTRADGTESTRRVWPLGLFFWGSIWTMGAWCELREAFRNFRLDRLRSLEICDEQYPHESGHTLEDMIACERKRR